MPPQLTLPPRSWFSKYLVWKMYTPGSVPHGAHNASAPTLRFAERVARAESAPTAQHLCGPVRLGPGLLNSSHSTNSSPILIVLAKHDIGLPIAATSPFSFWLPSDVILKLAAVA